MSEWVLMWCFIYKSNVAGNAEEEESHVVQIVNLICTLGVLLFSSNVMYYVDSKFDFYFLFL